MYSHVPDPFFKQSKALSYLPDSLSLEFQSALHILSKLFCDNPIKILETKFTTAAQKVSLHNAIKSLSGLRQLLTSARMYARLVFMNVQNFHHFETNHIDFCLRPSAKDQGIT